jgi:hypothetical protein
MRRWLRWEVAASEESYVIEVAITEQSSTASNYRPQAFPSALLGLRDAAPTFDVSFIRMVIALGLLFGD